MKKNRTDIADITWGPGFLLIAWTAFILSPFSSFSLAINILITIWAIRLAVHVFLKNQKRKEDFRYQNLKKSWKTHISLRIFFQVFILQGVILYIVSLPILWINTHPESLSMNFFQFAIPLWLVGFAIETVSDYQLLVFKRNASNKEELLKTGLWSFARHPNYLGEIIQWWAVWFMCISIPWGWVLIISPALITYLIVMISGIAPLEEKMKNYPEFSEYAKKTPALIPFSIFNALLYAAGWFILVFYGAKKSFVIPFFTSLIIFTAQIYFLAKFLKKSFLISIPLSIYALIFGSLQETIFIHSNLLNYTQQGFFPPFWLLALYPLFSLTLNASLSFLNKNIAIAFFAGGSGGLLSYHFGQSLNAVTVNTTAANPWIFISWGLYITILILLNRKLILLRDFYTDSELLKAPLTVFFDTNCPVCYREMVKLKKQEQTGSIIYACPNSDEQLKKLTHAFTYEQSMKKIHAIEANGNILTGIDVLSALYARTNLAILAIALQAPGFCIICKLLYAIWAKLRIRLNSR